jgi:hypothetical protein
MNDDLATLHPLTRILFSGLWVIADRDGKLEDKPTKIKAQTLPYDDHDVDKALDDLAAKDFVVRYVVDLGRYLALPRWCLFQKPHTRENPSEIPDPIADWERDSTGVLTKVVLRHDLGGAQASPHARQVRVQEQELVVVLKDLERAWPKARCRDHDRSQRDSALFEIREQMPADLPALAAAYVAAHEFTDKAIQGCPNLHRWISEKRWLEPLPGGAAESVDWDAEAKALAERNAA